MARKRMEEIQGKGLSRELAIELAKNVFKLQKILGISREQMAEESGLSRNQLTRLKATWANEDCKFKHMEPAMANALIRFWNLHLKVTNGEKMNRRTRIVVAKKHRLLRHFRSRTTTSIR